MKIQIVSENKTDNFQLIDIKVNQMMKMNTLISLITKILKVFNNNIE